MKILIIDNGTSYLEKVQNLLFGHNFETIKFSEVNLDKVDSFDAVILSGGHDFPVLGNENLLEKEINFVKNYKKPIFGVCFGFELIANAFGAKLELMENREKGIIEIEVIEPDEIFLNIKKFNVFESHRWIIKETGDSLEPLAKSKDGIEAIKHKILPIYGVRFHPEMFTEITCGDEIFYNFLNSIK